VVKSPIWFIHKLQVKSLTLLAHHFAFVSFLMTSYLKVVAAGGGLKILLDTAVANYVAIHLDASEGGDGGNN
jgi:hypothetical protein